MKSEKGERRKGERGKGSPEDGYLSVGNERNMLGNQANSESNYLPKGGRQVTYK